MTSTTNPRRYQDDLRRIVGVDEGARGLAPADPKPRIPGARGIAYTTESGGSATASGNAPSDGSAGTKVPTGASDGSNESGNDGLSSNGQYQSGIDGVNPGDFINPTDGPVSVDDLFDGKFGIGGNIPILTGFDCDTGKELQFIFDGGFIPPEGWDGPDSPPLDMSWEQGVYWSANSLITASAASAAALTALFPDVIFISSQPGVPFTKRGYRASTDGFGNTVWYVDYCSPTGCNPFPSLVYPISRNVCGINSVSEYCSITERPTLTEVWPSDNTIQLLRQDDGTWITSERDPDRTTPYTQPLSAPEFCDAQGRKYKPWPGRDGSTVFQREDGFYYVRNSDGRAFAFGSGSTIRDYLPPAVLPEIAP